MQTEITFFVCRVCNANYHSNCMGSYVDVCKPCEDEEKELQAAIAELYGEDTGNTNYHRALSIQGDE